jgi:hypothetical protein
MMKDVFARIGWYLRSSKARKKPSDGMRIAAEKSELKVLDAIKELPEVIFAWHALRIQDPSRRLGAGEVDVMALTTKGFVMIEVKNWAGSIRMMEGDIVQAKLRKKRPVFEPLEKKAIHLKRCAQTLIQEDALEVVTVVALTNSNAKASDEVLQHPRVTTLETLSGKINHSFMNHEPLSPNALNNYTELATCFGTWDHVKYEGGASYIGDLDDQLMPEEWSRENYRSVEISIAHGFWKTVFSGPKLSIRLTGWDGNVTTQDLTPPMLIKHTAPWEKGGIDGEGNYPISYLQTITYGFQHGPFGQHHARRLKMNLLLLTKEPSIDSDDTIEHLKHERNDAARPSLDDYSQKFSPGTQHKGTIVKHLTDDNDCVYALLVALVERKVSGRLHLRNLGAVHPDLFAHAYGVGTPLDVRIRSYAGPRKIELHL